MNQLICEILLGLAVAICIICGIGILVMRDAYQRLHFPTPVVSLSALFITIAVFMQDSDAGSRTKMVLICIVTFLMNGVLSHATARAVRIRKVGHWPIGPDDNIPLHDTGEPVKVPLPEQP